jgi:hypothetical protein
MSVLTGSKNGVTRVVSRRAQFLQETVGSFSLSLFHIPISSCKVDLFIHSFLAVILSSLFC